MDEILSMTVVKLREYAKENNISIRGLRLKKDIQDAILAHIPKSKSKTKNKYKSDDYIVEEEEDDTQETKYAKKITKFLYEMYGTTHILKEDPMFDKCGIGRYIYRNWETNIKAINIKNIIQELRVILKKYKLSIPRTTKNAKIALLFLTVFKDRLETTPEEYKKIVARLEKMVKN